ncbi:MAG: glutaredoxin family protein [Terriglobia bacterium]
MVENQVILYAKPGCCLCDEVRGQLRRLQERRSFAITEVNILEDAAAFHKFAEDIPVVFVNGHPAFRHRLEESKFLSLL